MKGRWFITPHAVRRYIWRVHCGISYEEALQEIIDQSSRAHYVKPYNDELDIWRGPKPHRIRFLVGHAFDGDPQLITVLKGHDNKRRYQPLTNPHN